MKAIRIHLIGIVLCLFAGGWSYAQNSTPNTRQLVQFSGIVVEADSLHPIPFTNIAIRHTARGTTGDFAGYFSFVAKKSDTVVFSAVGYKKSQFIIPDSIASDRYSLIQVLTNDTILLEETVIYPWPSREQFKEAFIHFDVPDSDYEFAMRNLEKQELKSRAMAYQMDGSMNYRHAMQQQIDRYYYNGQIQPNNLLNPMAWAQFFKAWKEGKFKKKQNK